MSGLTAGASSSSPLPAPADASLARAPLPAYLSRLAARTAAVGSCLCLGVDPDPESVPAGFPAGVAGIEQLARLTLEGGVPYAAAVKINVAFFEAFGSVGIAALERVRAQIPSDVPFIADVKRGDISTTSARQAVALFDALGADAITVSPYLGRDAIAPHLGRTDRFVYVLCRTSNAGAGEIQDLPAGASGEPLYVNVARRVVEWAAETGNVGLVVAATAPLELERVRAVAPGLPFLVPGMGTQGGDIEAVRRFGGVTSGPAAGARGGGVAVNVSRGIASAAVGAADPVAAVAAAAGRWAGLLRC